MAQVRWVLSMRIREYSVLVGGQLADSIGEKLFRIDAMSRIVRARINTTRFRQIGAQIAGGGFLFYDRFGMAGMIGIFIHHLKWMQINIAVRTIARAQTTTDAPIFDDDFE